MKASPGRSRRSTGSSTRKSSSGGNGGYRLSDDGNDDKKTTPILSQTDTGDSLKVDKNSITALGYGPISASRLNSLIVSGEVVEIEENGVLKYKRVK